VKAIAALTGYSPSPIASASFTISTSVEALTYTVTPTSLSLQAGQSGTINMLLNRYNRPALAELGITKRIGIPSATGSPSCFGSRALTSRQLKSCCGTPTPGSLWRCTSRLWAQKNE
jgi:hypothetical protein